MRLLDSETLAAQHLMPADVEIRERDLPERLQLAGAVRVVQEDQKGGQQRVSGG